MTRRVVAAALAVVAACYVPHILRGGWVYEDLAWLQELQAAPRWQDSRLLFRAFWWLQGGWSAAPAVVHAISVVLHFIIAGLTGLFVSRLGLSDRASRVAVIVVAVPAISVEAVAYAAQQGELLATIGVLGACILASGYWWRWPVWSGIVACLAIGLMGKESAVVGLVLVPLVMAVCMAGHWRERPLWAVPWVPGLIAAALLFVAVRMYGGPLVLVEMGEAPGVRVGAGEWALLQSTAAMRTLGLLLLPLGPFTVDYDYHVVPLVQQYLSVGGLVLLAALAWWLRTVAPLIALGLTGMLLIIGLRLIVQTPRSIFNDHQAYQMLPWFGLLVAAVVDMVREGRCRTQPYARA